MGAGFIQIGVGAELICTTFIIGELSNDSKENEQLTMTGEEESWFGKILKNFK